LRCECGCAEKQLAKYAEWRAPRAGMFLWLKLKQVDDSMDIFEELKAAKVVVVPGNSLTLLCSVALCVTFRRRDRCVA